jgi:LysM repeat protein
MPARSTRSTQPQLPFAHRRALRVAGAAGMTSLLLVTGYVIEGFGGSTGSVGASGSTDQTFAPVDTSSGTATALVPTLPASTLAPPASPTPATCTTTYTVVPGDSWSLIAMEASVGLQTVLAANNATTATMLYPGQVLCLPDGSSVVPTLAPVVTAPATTVAPVKKVVQPAAPAPKPQTKSRSSR